MKFFYTYYYSNSKGKNSIQKSKIGQTNPILTLNKLQSTFSFNGGSKTYTILYTYTIIQVPTHKLYKKIMLMFFLLYRLLFILQLYCKSLHIVAVTTLALATFFLFILGKYVHCTFQKQNMAQFKNLIFCDIVKYHKILTSKITNMYFQAFMMCEFVKCKQVACF